MSNRLCTSICLLLCASFALTANAQNSGRRFQPEDFLEFAPRTALDMVERIPGFSIDDVDDDRGLGQASGNVLINGERVSGKTNGPVQALSRIPAENVRQIEVLEGSTLGIPGLSGEVVNVVALASAVNGTWRWEFQRRRGQEPRWWEASAALSGSWGRAKWNIGFDNDAERRGFRGEEIFADADESPLEFRDEAGAFYFDQPSVKLGVSWDNERGHVGNANLAITQFNFTGAEDSDRLATDGHRAFRSFRSSEDEWNAEFGADYALDVGAGRLKLISLYRQEDSPTVAVAQNFDAQGDRLFFSRFARQADEAETILRSEYDWQNDQSSWQIAVEGAFNYLDIEAALTAADNDAPPQPVDLGNANSRVEEQRAEANVTYSRTLTSQLTLQTSAGLEYSELTQTGTSGLIRSFSRPKGFAALIYQPNATTQAALRLEREVGQLNFFDFISSVNLNDENANAGNPELVPEQSWVAELSVDKNFGELGAASIALFYAEIEDIVDRVPLGIDGEASGNLDSASRWGLEFSGTARFDHWGWAGARLDLETELVKSSVEDPVTGERRRITNDLIARTEAELRHDVPGTDWAWGMEYSREHLASNVRIFEVFARIQTPSFHSLYVEHKSFFGMTARLRFANARDEAFRIRREVYSPNRSGDLLFSETRGRRFGNIYEFTLSGTF